MVSWGCLRFVIVVFPDHTHYYFCMYWASWKAFIFITWYPNFQLHVLYSVQFGIKILHVAVFVKIPF